MKVTLTAKLKLTHDAEQKAALDRVSLRYRDALNYTSGRAFDEGKLSQPAKLQKLVYEELREKFGLPSQMACNVPRSVAATYKVQWTKLKQHQARKEAGHTKRRYKGLDTAPKFVSRTLTYNYGRDYGFKKAGRLGQDGTSRACPQVSVQTLEGRLVLDYHGYQKHLDFLTEGCLGQNGTPQGPVRCKVGAAKLWYDKPKKQYFLLVSFEVEVPDPQPTDHKNVVGVDVGQRYHAVVSDTRNNTQFFSGNETNQTKNQYAKIRKSLQRKGTRSATRRLVAFSGRERRFIADRNHQISSQILTRFPNSVIGLENLTHIRERTEGRSKAKDSPKMKAAKRRRSQWSFAEQQTFLAYKAPLRGSMTVRVDAEYTSQCCPKCGHTSKANRPKAGLMFVCENCGYEGHSDLVGSRNVTLRTLLIRQDWMSTGILSASPDVSGRESKAERLKRYSELRWSPETSPDHTALAVGGGS